MSKTSSSVAISWAAPRNFGPPSAPPSHRNVTPHARNPREPRQRTTIGPVFHEMADDAAADKAISMFDGSDMGGRRIAVNKARPMEERAPRGNRF